jgi:hypothetical protein
MHEVKKKETSITVTAASNRRRCPKEETPI